MNKCLQIFAMSFCLIVAIHARAENAPNPKSVELKEDAPLKEVISSQYFKITPLNQVEIKDLKGFISYKNENETMKCSFFKAQTSDKVKVALAANSSWENSSGIVPANRYVAARNQAPKVTIKFNRGNDSIDLNCDFTDRVTGMIETSREEDAQRTACEAKSGMFTRYSRKEYDYACDYRLKYSDFKKLFFSNGFALEVRHEPPNISVVVLGAEQPAKPRNQKKSRQPSSIKSRK